MAVWFDFSLSQDLQREIDRYFQRLAGAKRPLTFFSRTGWQPPADVYETADAVVAVIDVSGVPQDEINLVVRRNSLTVSGERRPIDEREARTYTVMEIPWGPFERTIHFRPTVEPDRATASYAAGLLEVVMPRAQPTRPRRVTVREG